tara:strand:+ start:335 stop:595 length:261 start_codon:yes stop_codon:yes gene_type:complete
MTTNLSNLPDNEESENKPTESPLESGTIEVDDPHEIVQSMTPEQVGQFAEALFNLVPQSAEPDESPEPESGIVADEELDRLIDENL